MLARQHSTTERQNNKTQPKQQSFFKEKLSASSGTQQSHPSLLSRLLSSQGSSCRSQLIWCLCTGPQWWRWWRHTSIMTPRRTLKENHFQFSSEQQQKTKVSVNTIAVEYNKYPQGYLTEQTFNLISVLYCMTIISYVCRQCKHNLQLNNRLTISAVFTNKFILLTLILIM